MYWKRKNGKKRLRSVEKCVRIEKTSLDLPEEQELLTEVLIEGVILDDKNHKDFVKSGYCNNLKKTILRKECTLHLLEELKK